MSKLLVTMQIEAMEFNAVVSFINSVNLHQLTDEELEILDNILNFKRLQIDMKKNERKKTVQDGNLGQHINKLV